MFLPLTIALVRYLFIVQDKMVMAIGKNIKAPYFFKDILSSPEQKQKTHYKRQLSV